MKKLFRWLRSLLLFNNSDYGLSNHLLSLTLGFIKVNCHVRFTMRIDHAR